MKTKIAVIGFCVCMISFLVSIGIAIDRQHQIDDLRDEIDLLEFSCYDPISFFPINNTSYIHENGTPYSCRELNQTLGDALIICDDFDDVQAVWTSSYYKQPGDEW